MTETVTETAQPAPEVPTVADTPNALPTPADFTIALKIKGKQCFGSAGCVVTYQIDPKYVGTADISSGSYEVTYEVTGGTDGTVINTFTQVGNTASFDSQETAETPSSATVLKVKITAVDTH